METVKWEMHEIVGGAQDGKMTHLPCREDGFVMWMNTSGVTEHVKLYSDVMLTADTPFRRYRHETRPDGTHVWREA
jgi:hypothetical protein